ncbi:phosphopantetheine-binding protein [Candidatus Mycoplasma mahonii]|uniref:phosphopantetheine-binding protein n=1 Tax=Candidatus Mycoplasma mahonii TaxID=3004105 RepID=UPI0026ED15EC|nr:phosphopantetheine-binding protein [Candidatus Mycoplasma mahonii]WKX02687.1 phosphopantetheine-binding protein [Candidatus Mycoplasma mahonii]
MKIKKLIYKKLSSLTKQKFDDESDVYEIGIDSLDLVELVTEAEEELNLSVSDEDLESIKKVKDILKVFKEVK